MPRRRLPPMVGVLPLLFALVLAGTARDAVEVTSAGLLVLGLGGSLLAWWLFNLLLGRLLRRARPAMLVRWDLAGQGLALLLFAWWCFGLGWGAATSWSSIQILPFTALLVAHWQGLARALGRRGLGLVSGRLRLGMLPMLVAVALLDLAQLALSHVPGGEDVTGLGFGLLAVLLIMLVLMPLAVMRLWQVRPLAAGPERDFLEEGCRRAGLPMRRIMTWPSAGGHFHNAAVLGALPGLRWLLFSRDLLRDLDPPQVLAVLGHELGHIRHRHLWWYLVVLLATAIWAGLLGQQLTRLLLLVGLDQWLGAATVLGLGQIVAFALLLGLGFGAFSRACERQADLAGARLAGDPRIMGEALLRIAHLGRIPLRAPSWRHGSIASRVAYLESVATDPKRAATHQHSCRRMAMTALLLLLLAPVAALWRQHTLSPDADLIGQALAGDDQAYEAWLRDLRPDQRRLAAGLLLQRMPPDMPVEELYRHRLLLRPFLDLGTDDPELDLLLINNYLYLALATVATPARSELERARNLLPVLEAQARESDNAAYLDTVGCIYFLLGDRHAAFEAFHLAWEALERQTAETSTVTDPDFADLLERRIAASLDPSATLPRER